jgi:hypothetical protein
MLPVELVVQAAVVLVITVRNPAAPVHPDKEMPVAVHLTQRLTMVLAVVVVLHQLAQPEQVQQAAMAEQDRILIQHGFQL